MVRSCIVDWLGAAAAESAAAFGDKADTAGEDAVAEKEESAGKLGEAPRG